MSISTMARVWENSTHSGTALLMLLAIADFADDDGKAYPAVSTLARKCRTSPRNANLILAALRDSKELVIRIGKGTKGTNLYQIPKLPPVASFTPEESYTLKPATSPPVASFLKPLKPATDKPSLNHHEPPEREQRSPKGSRITPDWKPNYSTVEWAKEKRPDLDPNEVAEKFRDYWSSSAGKSSTKADWNAAFKYWIRNENENKAPQKSKHTGLAETNYQKGIAEDGTF
jgi:hypothetical protein